MNNKVLNIGMEMDASSALSEVDKLDKRIKEAFAWSKQMKGGVSGSKGMDDMVANSKKLEKALDSTYKNMERLDKAMESGSFREQAKYSNKLKESLKDLDAGYKGLRRQLDISEGGFEDVNNAILRQIKNAKKAQEEMAGYYSKGLRARGATKKGYASAIGKATSSAYQGEVGSAQVYGAYKKAKQEQQEIANTLGKISKREDSINQKIRNRNQGLNKVVQESEKYSEVIAGEIIPANIKNTKKIEEARNKSKQLNKEIDEQVQEKRELLNLAVKNGATSEQIEAIHRTILNLEQERTQKQQQIANEIKKEKAQTKGLSSNFIKMRKVTKSLNSVLGLFVKKSNQAAKSQSKLGIKTNKTSREIIRQGGRTTGLIRTFSRWRNRILVATFALAGLVRGLQRATQFAIKARKQFIALRKVSENLGLSTTKVNEAARSLAADGLVSLKEASQAIKALVATGAPLKTVINNLRAMKDAAIANGRAGYTVGQNLVAYSRGIKQMRSQLADAAGVMRNISQILRDHPDLVSKYGKATALLKGYTEEAQRFAGTTEEMLKTLPGMVQALKGQFKLLSTEVGQSLATFSEKFVKFFLKKVKTARKTFEKREGELYSWAAGFGEQLTKLTKTVIDFMPTLMDFIKTLGGLATAFLNIINKVSSWIAKFGPLISSLGSVAAKIFVAKTAAFVLSNAVYAVGTAAKSLIVSLGNLGTVASQTSAEMLALGSTLKAAVPILTVALAGAFYTYTTITQNAKEKQAALKKEIKETNQAWDRLRSGALDVAESLNKVSDEMSKSKSNILSMVQDYMDLEAQISKTKSEITKLREKQETPSNLSPMLYKSTAASANKVNGIQEKINKKQEKLNRLSSKRISTSKDIIDLSDKISDKYKLQTAIVENRNGELEKGFEMVNMMSEEMKIVHEFTRQELINWVSINKELSGVLTGIQQINQEIKRMSGEAEKTFTEIKRDIEEIKFSDKYSEVIGFQREYNEEVSEYDKNIDKLISKRAKLEEKYESGTEAMRGYIQTVKSVFGKGGLEKGGVDVLYSALDEFVDISEDSSDRFKSVVTRIVNGFYTVEGAMNELKETTDAGEMFDESKIRSYLNLLKTYSETQENINNLTEQFGKVVDAAAERREKQMENFFAKWKQNRTEMKQGYDTNIQGIKSEIDNREHSIKTLNEKIELLKEKERITKSAENRIQMQELRLKYNERRNEKQREFNKSMRETENKIINIESKIKSIAGGIEGIKLDQFTKNVVNAEDPLNEINKKINRANDTVSELDGKYSSVEAKIRKIKAEGSKVNDDLIEREEKLNNSLESQRAKLKALKVIKGYMKDIGANREYLNQLEKNSENMIEAINEQKKQEIRLMKIRNEKERERIGYYKQFIDVKRKGVSEGGFIGAAANMTGLFGLGKGKMGRFQVLDEAEKRAGKALDKIYELRSKFYKSEDLDRSKELQERISKQVTIYKDALEAKENFWKNSNDIMRQGISQAVNMMTSYLMEVRGMYNELDKEAAAWNAKNEYYHKKELLTDEQYAKRKEEFAEYKADREKLINEKLAKIREKRLLQFARNVGKQLVIEGLVSVIPSGPWSLGIGAALMAGSIGIALSRAPSGQGAARQKALIGAKKETGEYGSAFESPGSGGGGSTDTGTGGSTAGSTVNAQPQTININPSIDFTGETLLLTPHGDVEEVGDALSNTIVNEVKDAVETGRLDL